MNWIRKEKRLAIYMRDGLACGYCGEGIEDGATLTLDHLVPNAKGGCNEPHNLITACHRCNSRRGTRSVRGFCKAVASFLNIDYREIEKHIRNAAKRKINVAAAKELIARRGGFVNAMNAGK